METKSKYDIAKAIEEINLPEMPLKRKIAQKLAKEAIEEYANELIDSNLNSGNGLKYYIEQAIENALEIEKKIIEEAVIFGYNNSNDSMLDPNEFYNKKFLI